MVCLTFNTKNQNLLLIRHSKTANRYPLYSVVAEHLSSKKAE